jgi:biotin carboxyl carrier protein
MQATVNGQYEFDLTTERDYDLISNGDGSYSMIYQDQSYVIIPQEYDANAKLLSLSVNGQDLTVQIADHYDLLVKELGFALTKPNVFKDVKAPMPGLVLEIAVSPGDQVQEGDTLIILEAMKMENVIKAPGDGTIKSVVVKPKDAIEKNAVLIEME